MSPEAIRLVKTSFAYVIPISGEASRLFYDRLFSISPELRALFTRDMQEQGRVLMLTLATIVHDLDKLDRLVPAAQDLARRHVQYGVIDAHYPLVGDALLWTLEQGLGPRFTPAVRAAWAEAYGLLADAMTAATR